MSVMCTQSLGVPRKVKEEEVTTEPVALQINFRLLWCCCCFLFGNNITKILQIHWNLFFTDEVKVFFSPKGCLTILCNCYLVVVKEKDSSFLQN